MPAQRHWHGFLAGTVLKWWKIEMATIVILAVLAAFVALLIGFTTGKDRYAEMSEEEFEAQAKRASLLGAAVMGLQKVLEPKHVEYMMQRDKKVEGDSAEAADHSLDDPPAR
jgi:mannose/fructose/N-acetylgalactosamine-specific phosphotransferase system component IID